MSNSGRKKPLVADRRYGAGKPKPKPKAKPKKPVNTRRKPATKPARKRVRKTKKRNFLVAALLGLLGWLLRILWGFGWRIGVIVSLILAMGIGYYYSTLPNSAIAFMDERAKGSVTLLDDNSAVFAWRGDQFGGIVSASTVSPHLKNAVIATEDKRFYNHFGVSPRGVASAVRINLAAGRGPLSGNGGSTITQQTAKLICLGTAYDAKRWETERAYEKYCRQGSLWRKVKEATYALAMEAKYSKDEILSIYMNRAFLGAGARGFEAASQRYFAKSAAEVSAPEAAMLAGLLKAPTRYAPTNSLQRSQDRAATVVKLMREQGYLSPEQALDATNQPAELSAAAKARAGGYFADWVMASGPEFFTRNTTEDVIIRTTLDQRLQTAAEDAMTYVFENKVSPGSKAQAAIVVMSADGAVRAMVGGRDVRATGAFNRATQAMRQTGSAFKPFVYATALELGYSYSDLVNDAPYTVKVPGSGNYSPTNYDHKFHGNVTLLEALKRSYNVPAVKVAMSVGLDLVRRVASDFGIKSELALGPALALGASESTLLEMTGAYAGILNGGSAVTPYGLVELRLMGDDEPLMGTGGGIGERVINTSAARELTYMMYKVVQEGTGRRAMLEGREVAGKTGTTQAARDAWFIGFSGDYVAGVWMGYDDNTPLTGVTGSGLPAEIWHETMVRVHEGLPIKPLPMLRPSAQPTARQIDQTAPRKPKNAIERLMEQLRGETR
ncbi:MAG: PBP1A family penicillin-binding protein [Rhodobacterales bacterium]|nr:PBP1A family penicillin-binding protein [Rhodobacterales bacterium]